MLTPEEITQVLIELTKKGTVVDANLPSLCVQAGYDYALSQALLKVDGDLRDSVLNLLVKDCRSHEHRGCICLPENHEECWGKLATNIAFLLSPHLQAAADKEWEIERLRERIDADQYLKDEMFLKSEVDDRISQAVQQAKQDERERIEIQHIDAINDYVKGKISFERCADINFYELAEFCTVRRQALQDGKE